MKKFYNIFFRGKILIYLLIIAGYFGVRVFLAHNRWTDEEAGVMQKLTLYKQQLDRLRSGAIERDTVASIEPGAVAIPSKVFDRNGKYLYFFASTDAGPSNNWFSLQNQDNRPTRSLWLMVLRNDVPSPLVRESDEEKGAAAPPATSAVPTSVCTRSEVSTPPGDARYRPPSVVKSTSMFRRGLVSMTRSASR